MGLDRANRLVHAGLLVLTVLTAIILALAILPGRRDDGTAPPKAASSRGPDQSLAADALPPSPITSTVATRLARAHVQDGARVQTTAAGRYRDVFVMHPIEPGSVDDLEKLVWAVTFDEDFVICPPNGSPCWTPRPGRTQVILDYYTGEFLEAASVAPA